MGLSSRIAVHARHRHGAHRPDDPRKAPPILRRIQRRAFAGLIAAACLAAPGAADSLRVATFNTELARDGPGLFLRDILKGGVPDIDAALDRITRADADILLLQGVDYDLGLVALSALAQALRDRGLDYPHVFAGRPNTGMPTGLDIDGDGRHGPRDAQGYGRFSGQGGMAVLSRHPVTGHRDHSGFLWADLPGGLMTGDDPGAGVQRLSSVAHWTVTIAPDNAAPLHLLAFHATPPVFDGPEDRNGRRNHDEAAFWSAYLNGDLPEPPPKARFILLGDANLDPMDGDGRPAALTALLTDPRLQDPAPSSPHGAEQARSDGGANVGHAGAPRLDTANWRDDPGPGNLRVDYVLPSADWRVTGAGILWPDGPEPAGKGADGPSRHGLVWVDLAQP